MIQNIFPDLELIKEFKFLINYNMKTSETILSITGYQSHITEVKFTSMQHFHRHFIEFLEEIEDIENTVLSRKEDAFRTLIDFSKDKEVI